LIDMSTKFCEKHLDMEYAALCEKLIKKLGRKKAVLYENGQLQIWASAIVLTIASINFLMDKTQNPQLTVHQICDFFGTKTSTVSNKAKEIKGLCKINPFSWEFLYTKIAEDHPFKDEVMVM